MKTQGSYALRAAGAKAVLVRGGRVRIGRHSTNDLGEGRFTLQPDNEPRECSLRELFAQGVTARVDRAPLLRDATRTA